MATIKEKVINVFGDRVSNNFLREEIIDLIVNGFPGTNPTSVIPSDYCYNMANKGINFDFHLFESLGEREGRYHCIGLKFPYNGAIYWKGEQFGEWKNGKFRLWKNAPQRVLRRWGLDQWIDPSKLEK
jgi:hypothetical protein